MAEGAHDRLRHFEIAQPGIRIDAGGGAADDAFDDFEANGATESPAVRNLFSRFDQLDVLLQERIDEFVQGHSARLGAGRQKGQHLRVEMHRRRQDAILAKKPAAFGLREIVFVLHVIGVAR